VRGGALTHAGVIEALRPFIVASWSGRDEDDMPKNILALHRESARERRSNIHCYVLDAAGKRVASFAAWAEPKPGQRRMPVLDHDGMGRHVKAEIERASASLDLPKPAEAGLHLPDVASGVRVILTLKCDRERMQFRAPVVATVPWSDTLKKALAKSARVVEASELRAWFDQLVPPGVMDGMGGTKRVSGTIRVEPAGDDRAIVRGRVKIELDNRGATVCEGEFEAVVGYKGDEPATVRAIFDGVYPKEDLAGRPNLEYAMKATFESRPD